MTTCIPPRRGRRLLGLAVCVLMTAGPSASVAGRDAAAAIAVVAHPGVQVSNLTRPELRRLLLGDRAFWPSGDRVVILIRAPIARERDVIVRDVCEMTEAQFRTHWIGKIFRAETPSGPRIVSSAAMALDQVRNTPGAMTFVDLADVGPGVTVLAIDGKPPTDPAYRFR